MRMLVSVLILGLAAVTGYLVLTHQQWVQQNQQLRDEAAILGTELAANHQEMVRLSDAAADTAAQLEEAKARVSELANQDANASDSLHVVEDLMQRMVECAEQRQRHIDVLSDPTLVYTDSSTAQVERSITEFCDAVSAAWDDHVERTG